MQNSSAKFLQNCLVQKQLHSSIFMTPGALRRSNCRCCIYIIIISRRAPSLLRSFQQFFTTSRPVFTLNNNNSARVNNRLVVQCLAFTRPSNLACWREMSELELFHFLCVMVLERSLEDYDPEQQFYDWVNEISTLIT